MSIPVPVCAVTKTCDPLGQGTRAAAGVLRRTVRNASP